MIKVSELRIGNLVKAPLGEILKVEQIGHPDNPDYILATNENGFGQNGFEGVELSPEILEKAGFKKNPHVGWSNIRGVYSIEKWWSVTEIEGKWLFGFDEIDEGFSTLATIRYLHQLQNIYFPLAKKELTITL